MTREGVFTTMYNTDHMTHTEEFSDILRSKLFVLQTAGVQFSWLSTSLEPELTIS